MVRIILFPMFAMLPLLATEALPQSNRASEPPLACALREAEMMALFETREAENAPQEVMARAASEMHRARIACYGGRDAQANAVYSNISDLLGPLHTRAVGR